MTNIRDIANLSGYSVSTVSRLINQNGYVSKKAQQKIQYAINKLNFVPNDIARHLSKGKSINIGVVVPYTHHPYFTQIISGILEAAFYAKNNIVILQSNYNKYLEIKYLEKLHRKSFDSLIFTSQSLSLKKLAYYKKYGFIVCCENPKRINLAAVYPLRKQTYLKVFKSIKEKHFKRVSILLNRKYSNSSTSKVIINAFNQIFASSPIKKLINTHITTFQDGYLIAQKYIKNNLKPDFIFTNDDDVAAGVYKYYSNHNLKIPFLFGQENHLSSKLLNISTIDHHLNKIGQLAFKLAFLHSIKKIPIKPNIIIR